MKSGWPVDFRRRRRDPDRGNRTEFPVLIPEHQDVIDLRQRNQQLG
jgi:hypothetical protein